jgi:hypothetical protein
VAAVPVHPAARTMQIAARIAAARIDRLNVAP